MTLDVPRSSGPRSTGRCMVGQLTCVDSWFFRESRPHSSAGAPFLTSHFPPPARTVAGAVRAWLGDALGVDWAAFRAACGGPVLVGEGDERVDVREWIGWGGDLGRLRFGGPWVVVDGRRLYPVPRHLVVEEGSDVLRRLEVGPSVATDAGPVCLPRMPASVDFGTTLRAGYVDGEALARVLAGGEVRRDEVVTEDDLVRREPRIGIGRDLERATAEARLLYQTEHVRLRRRVTVEVDLELVAGLGDAGEVPARITRLFADEATSPGRIVPRTLRLGGEGRLAGLVWRAVDPSEPGLPAMPCRVDDTLADDSVGLLVVAMSPVDLSPGAPRSEARSFAAHAEPLRRALGARLDGSALGSARVEVVSAVLGKSVAEGGWDLARGRPRAMRGLTPAGSVWFVRLRDADGRRIEGARLAPAAARWHGARVGDDTALGRGLLAVGRWRAADDRTQA